MRNTVAALIVGIGLICGAGCNLVPLILPSTGNNPDLANDPNVEPFDFFLKVARHEDQEFSSTRMDTIFLSATRALNIVNVDCPDLFCPTSFLRDGEIDTFSAGSAIVTTEAQLDDIFEDPANIKIVRAMVGVCGQSVPDDMTIVLGCAFTGGSAVLVQNAPADVWAHEWGHVQGLPHRDSCARNLMHAFELQTNAVDQNERDAFLSPTPSRSIFRAIPASEGAPDAGYLARADGESVDTWIDRLTTRRYLAGLPVSVLNGEDDRALREQLEQAIMGASTAEHCNLFRCLGFVGNQATCETLLGRITGLRGVIDDDQLAALAEALLALGRLADRDVSGAAMRFLIDRTRPDAWREQALTLDGLAGGRTLDQDLARMAVMAIGVTGHADAEACLQDLAEACRESPPADRWMQAQIDEALARQQGDWQRLKAGNRSLRLP